MAMADDLVMRQDRVTYAGAMVAIGAAVARSNELGVPVSICVVDRTGGPVAIARLDGPHASTIDAARGKAAFAGTRGRTTEDFVEKRLKEDEVLWRAVSQNPDTFLVPGGYPLMQGDLCVGGVGVSGGKYADDVKIAEAAAEAFRRAASQD